MSNRADPGRPKPPNRASWELARLLVREGRYEEAREHIKRALADTSGGIGPGFEIARACLTADKIELATELSEKLLAVPERVISRNTGAIMMLARAFHGRRKYAVAEKCCRAIAGFRRKDAGFLTLYGRVLLSKGEVEQAREVLERAVFLAPGSDKAPRLLLALSHFNKGNTELGKAYLSEAVGFEEESEALTMLFGSAALFIPYFGADIDQGSGSDDSIVNSTLFSHRLPDFDVSSADLVATAQLLLSRKPQLEKLVHRKNYIEMSCLRHLGFTHYDDAELALSRINSIAGTLLKLALASKADDPVVLNRLASLYRETGQYESALACDELAMINSPGDDKAKIGAAQSLLALRRFDEAIDAVAGAKGMPRDRLECIQLMPFMEWGGRIGQVSMVNTAEPLPYHFTAALDGKTTLIDCVIDQMPLSVVQAQDVTVIDGYIPVKNGAAHVYEYGHDVLQWISQATWKNAFIHKTNTNTRVIEKPCIYLSGAGWHYENYYHALAQNFPRLARLLDSAEYTKFSIAVPVIIRPWGIAFLKEMGVPEDRLILLPCGENALFRHIVTPIMRRAASKDEIQALRRKLGTDARPRGTRRFFVGRRMSPSHPRLLVNEQEIAGIAADYGFEEIDTASMSIRQQIDLFGEAAAVCGPNGAAFGNLIHAPDNTAVICMSPRETLASWYPDLAGLCNQSFYWCFGGFLPEGRNSRKLPEMPYFIDPDDFRRLLGTAIQAAGEQ